ncbi:MAG: Holliday junction branch migration protein RuvA [Clostridia bacterium]|nr:Holliday junction branch migration protein RuvA [Clostridia bacterium]
MIYYLNGKLTELTPSFAAVECMGVAYGAVISAKTYEKLVSIGGIDASGEATEIGVKLYTAVKIKDENQFEVFGFYSKAESAMFSLLQTVSGVGPKAALAILSALEPEQICAAIRTDDIRLISTAQGVGQKAAQKICIDLKNKIDSFTVEYTLSEVDVSRETSTAKANLDENEKLALEALTNLGYTKAQAQKALSKASGNTAEDLIRTALSHLYN